MTRQGLLKPLKACWFRVFIPLGMTDDAEITTQIEECRINYVDKTLELTMRHPYLKTWNTLMDALCCRQYSIYIDFLDATVKSVAPVSSVCFGICRATNHEVVLDYGKVSSLKHRIRIKYEHLNELKPIEWKTTKDNMLKRK